jgi:hypothetical protein
MDMKVKNLSAYLQPPQPKKLRFVVRHCFITAMSIAKAHRDKAERADLAARWVTGNLTIRKPTPVLASKVFAVSPTMVREALRNASCPTVPAIETAWTDALYRDREDFVRAHADELLSLIDRVTAPPVAA